MRLKRPGDDSPNEVPITPLIDCVFLLIIFFLVTSMFKRFEMLIPIQLPDATSALSAEASDESIRLAIDQQGNVLEAETVTRGRDLGVRYQSIPDFAAFLQTLNEEFGPDAELLFSVARNTPTQKVIDVLDIAQLQGFKNVSVRSMPHEY